MARQYRFQSIASSERSDILYERIKAKSRIKKVNAMLKALKKEDLYDESVAVENIFNYLGTSTVDVGVTKSGYISTRGIKIKSITQLTGVNKAISEFLKNKTSTVAGMEDLYEERRRELIGMFGDDEFIRDLSYKDLRNIYSVFQSKEYDKENKRFDSSTFFTIYTQAIDEKMDKTKFLKEMENYMDFGRDETLKEDLSDIYDKFISNYANR